MFLTFVLLRLAKFFLFAFLFLFAKINICSLVVWAILLVPLGAIFMLYILLCCINGSAQPDETASWLNQQSSDRQAPAPVRHRFYGKWCVHQANVMELLQDISFFPSIMHHSAWDTFDWLLYFNLYYFYGFIFYWFFVYNNNIYLNKIMAALKEESN